MHTTLEMKYKHYQRRSRGRKSLEKFISKVYQKVYKADISFFHQNLLTVESSKILGVIGYSNCRRKIFLEQYLNDSIEIEIEKLAMLKVKRKEIAEVGNLAAIKSGSGTQLIMAMTECLYKRGYKYAVFTGTSQIFSIFNKLNYTPLILSSASASQVKDAGTWGTYYDYSPRVAVADLKVLRRRLQQNQFHDFKICVQSIDELISKEYCK